MLRIVLKTYLASAEKLCSDDIVLSVMDTGDSTVDWYSYIFHLDLRKSDWKTVSYDVTLQLLYMLFYLESEKGFFF